jgi:Type II secretion system (T2SS), protein M subtype b
VTVGRVFSSLAVLISPLVLAAIPIGLAWMSYVKKVEDYQVAEETYVRLARIARSDIPLATAEDVSKLLTDVALGNDTPAILGAGLQSRLRDIAQQNGLEVVQVADMELAAGTTPEESQIQRIGVRVDLSGAAKGAHSFLASIETMKPWLFIDNVRIQSGFIEGAESETEPPMQLSLDVWGLRLLPAKKATP